ncbi:hypothetical protein A3A93_01095 [Candidatus Roizmanbacteria bacterium RIFCSPLOWO2_01_FULL_38_12]|uniref:ABC transporter domain-containing protein n=1 Tax=Candidatus Roizmanbacteria bacterium RIFCSPLOWO2_01_FULL_38_12 TaxID=1802061 RepID=A0A1F7IRA0_9BACT|nr:MAG: hypothetical protein A3A93_01095 [Candidatus Roizmanbacteria bacterium RIFCSPLOWO2_01_FULL_38_12]
MKKVFDFNNVFVRLHGAEVLKSINWIVTKGQNWVILGLNGAGKSTLVKSLFEDFPYSGEKNCIYSSHEIGYVSFDIEKKILTSPPFIDIANNLQLRKRPLQDLSTLSTGQMRQLIIARALDKKPKLLILDEPFDGLDEKSRVEFKKIITDLMKGIQILLITHRFDEILDGFSRILVLHNGKVFAEGKRTEILNNKKVRELFEHEPVSLNNIFKKRKPILPRNLIDMKNVTVCYGDKVIFKKFNWVMKRGENWAILGPNGAGKTSLLRLITGDNLQAYSQNIKIFGRQKGTGESVWDIKKNIAEVSGDIQIKFQKSITVLEVVESGFFDSIGLFRKATSKQYKIAKNWISRLGLNNLKDHKFAVLSQGQQRMVIIARAMVKSPLLLILDEPTTGLDMKNRKKILELIDLIGTDSDTQLIFVTHYKDEIPKSITKALDLY